MKILNVVGFSEKCVRSVEEIIFGESFWIYDYVRRNKHE